MSENVFSKYQLNFNEDVKSAIIEATVAVYGEECRSMIEERMDRILVIQYITPDDLQKRLTHEISQKNSELALKFLASYGFDAPENIKEITEEMKNVLKTVFGWSTFCAGSYQDIFSFDKQENTSRVLKSRCKVLNSLGMSDVTPENYDEFANSVEGQNKIEEINRILTIVKELNSEFNLYKSGFESEERYLTECDALKSKLNLEAVREYFSELKDFLPEEDRVMVEKALELPEHTSIHNFLSVSGKKYFNNSASIENMAYIEAFDGEELDYEKELARVSYFRGMGLDLGYDYSAYKDNEDAKKIEPSLELAKKVKELRQKYGNRLERDMFLQTGTMASDIEKINSLGLLGGTVYSKSLVEEGGTCVEPNAFINNDGKVENINLMFFPALKGLPDYKDVTFIHEVLHCLECSMQEKDGQYIFSTGFEKVNAEFNVESKDVDIDKEVDKDVRTYEKFSENIHQRLAIEVYRKIVEAGISLFPNIEEQQSIGGTSYENLNFVTNEFYSEFKSQITYARMSGNLDRLGNYIGRENFEQLNSVVSEYNSLPYYSMMSDIIEKRETPLVARRNELGEMSHNIVQNMLHTREIYDRA